MIVDTDGYIELVQYLTGQLPLFAQNTGTTSTADYTLRELLEEKLGESMITVFEQNQLEQETRLDIVREADAIMYDLEEVLSSVLNNHPTAEQEEFVVEFVGLVKNLFDQKINS